jgi:hypothetical protein
MKSRSALSELNRKRLFALSRIITLNAPIRAHWTPQMVIATISDGFRRHKRIGVERKTLFCVCGMKKSGDMSTSPKSRLFPV